MESPRRGVPLPLGVMETWRSNSVAKQGNCQGGGAEVLAAAGDGGRSVGAVVEGGDLGFAGAEGDIALADHGSAEGDADAGGGGTEGGEVGQGDAPAAAGPAGIAEAALALGVAEGVAGGEADDPAATCSGL